MIPRIAVLIVVVAASVCAQSRSRANEKPVALTAAERAAGWRPLFDGVSTDAWRGYRRDGFPTQGWVVEDGCLKVQAGGGGGDLITRERFDDFELTLEWRTAPKANSGIMYRVTERHDASWQTGPEFQVLDDAGHGLEPGDAHASGALYDLQSPPEDKVVHPTGSFNHARIRVARGRIEHWLNGRKVVDCPAEGPEWAAMIAKSKFRSYEGFGVEPRGHIALQDHGNDVWFRNIRVRDLDAPAPGERRLFNGRDLDGLVPVLTDATPAEKVWSVRDGILICTGKPNGYIRTAAEYESFVLKLEWRFSPVTKKDGNSGVLVRKVGEDKVWPQCVEAQLQSGRAGDFWNLGDPTLRTDPARTKGRNTRHLHPAERPVGEWNDYEIIVDGGSIVLKVNGQVLNAATDATVVPGHVCFQSEGVEIQFRKIRLTPIP